MNFSGYDPDHFYDELIDTQGKPREGASLLIDRISGLPNGDLRRRQEGVTRAPGVAAHVHVRNVRADIPCHQLGVALKTPCGKNHRLRLKGHFPIRTKGPDTTNGTSFVEQVGQSGLCVQLPAQRSYSLHQSCRHLWRFRLAPVSLSHITRRLQGHAMSFQPIVRLTQAINHHALEQWIAVRNVLLHQIHIFERPY